MTRKDTRPAQIIRGLGTLYTWNVVSPRLGVTARLTSDGRTILRASYGRFNQGVLTGEISPIHPGVTPVTTTAFDPATGGYTRLVSVVDPNVNLSDRPIDRHAEDRRVLDRRRSRTELSLVGGGCVHPQEREQLHRVDRHRRPVPEETRTLPDGRSLPVFVLTSPTSSSTVPADQPRRLLADVQRPRDGVEKRRSNGWQASGSYTFSRAYGLQASSGASAADPQVSTVAPAFPTATFGRDPNNLTNANGRLPNDRPHMFRLMGTVDVPRTGGLTVSGNLQYFSGKPWAATTQVSLPQGDQRILLEPRGSRRLSSQTLLDLRVSYAFRVGQLGRIDVIFDVLNALNDTAEEALATDNFYSPNFGQPTVFMDPRRAMLGVRLNLGR